MKKIYFIFECDSHASWESYCLKGIYTNAKKAASDFKKAKKEFNKNNPDNWQLKLVYCEEINTMALDRNMIPQYVTEIDSNE